VENKESKIESFVITIIKDVDDILALYPEANNERLVKIKSDVEKDIAKAEKGERIVYGFKNDEKIVGTIQLIFIHEKEFYADGKTKAHLSHTRVGEEFRRRGIGGRLIKKAEAEAKQRGFESVTLGVDEDNKQAIRLYERLGYKEFMRELGDMGEMIIGMKKDL